MQLYIMRHAEAVEASDTVQEEWRYLTGKGRLAAKEVSLLIAQYGPKPRLTITSPLPRAVQTAEIAAIHACRRNEVVANELLLPGGDVIEMVTFIKGCTDAKRVLLVGHEPQLSALAAALLSREGETIALKKGACLALKLDLKKDGKPADFLWYLAPGAKVKSSLKKAFPQQVKKKK